MAQNPYVNRVETADGTTLMDISDTTATEGDVISGKTLYKANGQKSVGTLDINGKADKVANATSGNFAGLDSNGNLTDSGKKASDFILATAKGANSGIAELDSNGKVPASQLPSYVDDVIEAASKDAFPSTGESGKIYVAQDTNKTYRWSGTAYVEISPSLALGETSSTAYRGDRGKAAYDHASAKGSAFASGLYKITTNSEGHVTAATAVAKADITGLGIPGSDTNTHRPIQVNGTEVLGNNTTALNLKAGSNVSVTNSSGTVTIAATDTNTTYTLTQDTSDGHKITLTPSSGSATTITIPDNNTDTKVTSAANHYAPSTASGSDVTASASGATAAWSIDVVKGVTLNTDGKGHVTGMSVTSGKIPANPNTDTKVRQTLVTNDNTNRPLLLAYSNTSTTTANVDDVSYRANTIYANQSTGTVTATNFAGKINNHTVNKDVPSNAVFTDTTYSAATQSADGLMSSTDKTKLDGVATGATANVGTVTGVKMNNGSAVSPDASGVVNLGTVITSHQDISGKADKSSVVNVTAAAGSWTSATPPTQTISVTGVTASNNIIVSLASTATSAEYAAAAAGQLLCTAQGAGEITVTCYGTEPTENIPLTVMIVG